MTEWQNELVDQFLHEEAEHDVSPWWAFWIFLIPLFTVWGLLRPGYSLRARVLGFGWFVLWVITGYCVQ